MISRLWGTYGLSGTAWAAVAVAFGGALAVGVLAVFAPWLIGTPNPVPAGVSGTVAPTTSPAPMLAPIPTLDPPPMDQVPVDPPTTSCRSRQSVAPSP